MSAAGGRWARGDRGVVGRRRPAAGCSRAKNKTKAKKSVVGPPPTTRPTPYQAREWGPGRGANFGAPLITYEGTQQKKKKKKKKNTVVATVTNGVDPTRVTSYLVDGGWVGRFARGGRTRETLRLARSQWLTQI